MNILVCISKTPDTTTKISFTDNDSKFNEAGVQYIVNPYDEWYALVRGLELKESNGGKVTVITVGEADCDPIVRKALAIGADDAVRIDAKPDDALFVANQIAKYAADNAYDMVLAGKETIDYNGAQVGGMIAEILSWPYVALATKLDMNGSTATISREVAGGVEILEVNGPFVLGAAKGMAEQRIPNMRGIMAARTKPLQIVPATELAKHTSIEGYTLPPAKAACKYVDPENMDELVQLLHNEAKAI